MSENKNHFSGSYLQGDVEFLLKKIDMPFTEVDDKESRIQNNTAHYSEMLSREYEPTKEYEEVFQRSFDLNSERFAKDIFVLAENLMKKEKIVLVSLVRAGTPIGVLLKRTLRDYFKRDVNHYSISIIRDREIDKVALKYIVDNNPDAEVIFVDGWTGKGVINRELKEFVSLFNEENNTNISSELYVVADIAGVADFSATRDDYLIPSATLNSTISGLVSRSILNDEYIFKGDYHGCHFYEEYSEVDLSLTFVDKMMEIILSLPLTGKPLLRRLTKDDVSVNKYFLNIQKEYNIDDINLIKPGIGESTRVLLRRVPLIVLVKNIDSKEIEHLKVLCREKNVRLVEDKDMPFTSLSVIRKVD